MWISLKAFGSKVMAKNYFFCCAGNVGPTRVQSDLLNKIAFEALPLVVCTKGLMYKNVVDTSLHPSTSWE